MENPTEAGAISRSASSRRKSRIASTGNRRTRPPRDIGLILPVTWPATLADTPSRSTVASPTTAGQFVFPAEPVPARGSAQLVDPGPDSRRVILTGQPQHRLPALVPGLEARISRKAASPVGPDHLQAGWSDVAVVPVADGEQGGRPPARADRPDRERARADPVDLISGFDHRAVRDALADRVQDDRHVLDGEPEHGQLRALVAEPQADGVRPGRRDLVAEHRGYRPADGTDVIGDGLHAGLRVEVDPLGHRVTFRAPAPLLRRVGAASPWRVHATHVTRGVRHVRLPRIPPKPA